MDGSIAGSLPGGIEKFSLKKDWGTGEKMTTNQGFVRKPTYDT
jgi:hypothetical protein